MILLMQSLKYPPEGWEDMTVPPKPDAMPVRGEKPRVETAEELAAVLQKAELAGVYRIVTDEGTYRIEITKVDMFVSKIDRVV